MSDDNRGDRPIWGPDLERDIADEVASHLEMHEEDLARRGADAGAAAARARARFGDVRRITRECLAIDRAWQRDQRRVRLWSDLRRDVILALRALRRSPVASAVIVLSLALGIGGATAIFSLASAVLVRPLAYPDADHLVFVWSSSARTPLDTLTPGRFADIREGLTSMSVAGISQFQVNLDAGREAVRVDASSVSSAFFDILGTRPFVGSVFHAGQPEAPVVVFSHALWTNRFAADPAILNRDVVVGGLSRRVIGVMPRDFAWPSVGPSGVGLARPELWLPAGANDMPTTGAGTAPTVVDREASFLRVIGRVRAQATMAEAQREATAVATRIDAQHPQTDRDLGIALVPLRRQFFGSMGGSLRLAGAMVGLLLLVICVNVAHLVLGQSAGRQADVAVRLALGAPRGRIVRQVFVETGVLVGIGALGGLAVTAGVWRILPAYVAPAGGDALPATPIEGSVLLFALLVALAITVVCSALPAWHIFGRDVSPALAGRGSMQARAGAMRGLRQALIVAEIAMSAATLTGAAALVERSWRLSHVNLGIRTDHLLTFTVGGGRGARDSTDARVVFFRDVLAAIRAEPGVDRVAAAATLPVGGDDFSATFTVAGAPAPPRGQEPRAGLQTVSPGYFDTIGMRVTSGRDVRETDTTRAPLVALVNDTFAAKYLEGREAIGRQLKLGRAADDPLVTIVGIVTDVRHLGPSQPPRAEFYLPYTQRAFRTMAMVVRTKQDPNMLVPAMRAAVRRVDVSETIANVQPMDVHVERALAAPRTLSALVSTFGLLALALAAMGIYGVMSWAVAAERQALAVRLAIGATAADIRRLVFRQSVRLAILGLALGTTAAALLAQSLREFLTDVGPLDLTAVVSVAVIVLLTALVGAAVPAIHAGRITPGEVLR